MAASEVALHDAAGGHTMKFHGLLQLCVGVSLITSASARSHDPLQCAEGTEFRSKSLPEEDARTEWCESPNGLREGPYRFVGEQDGRVRVDYTYRAGLKHGVSRGYHDDGKPRWERVYRNGDEIRYRLSREALRRMVADANAKARDEGKGWQMLLLGDRTLQYNVTIGPPMSWFPPAEQDIRQHILSSGALCPLIQLEGAMIPAMHVRYIDKSGSVLSETMINHTECAEPSAIDP